MTRRIDRWPGLAAGFVWLAAAGWCQETAGSAEIGYQHFYFQSGSREIAHTYGVTAHFREFVPRLGILTLDLAPAASSGSFRTGESYAELTQLPWAGQYWTFRGGDFRLPGRLLDVSFNNLYYPEITIRGGWVEAKHGGRTVGVLYGAETLQAGFRVPLRQQTPQTVGGAYLRQQVGERLVVSTRVLRLATDLEKLKTTPNLAFQNNTFGNAWTATVGSLYTVAGPLKWYSEAGWSTGSEQLIGTHAARQNFSVTSGPLFETERLTMRANYIRQTASYLPLLGYAIGDRSGPYGEVRFRALSNLEVYGSASDYRNNVANDPALPTFRSRSESAGGSLQLPGRFSVSGSWSTIRLATRVTDSSPWVNASNQQVQLMVARRVGGHSLRVAVREFLQHNIQSPQRQRLVEIGDTFSYKRFTIGGDVRGQRFDGQQSKTSIFLRANVQMNLNRLSLYANLQSGNDLTNRTLFATSALNTTVFGGNLRVGQDWNFNVQAFRNSLVTSLNPENVFVLQGQGVGVPSVLTALNQWSLYLHMTKQFHWGAAMPSNTRSLADYALRSNPLRGSVEGFVTAERRGVEGIPVALDRSTTVLTDTDGRFRFESVGEGARTVGIALNELPADFDAGDSVEATVLVRPGKISRVDLDVKVVAYAVHGRVVGPAGASLDDIVLKLLPTDRYTTPSRSGQFHFYNVPPGEYVVALAEETLPEHAVLKNPAKQSVMAVPPGAGADSLQASFAFEIVEPAKPVRQVILPGNAVVIPQRTEPSPVETAPTAPKPEAPAAPKMDPPAEERKPAQQALRGAPPASGARTGETLIRTAQQLNKRGRDLTAAGNYQAAVAVLAQAIEIQPDYALAYNARGYAFLRLTKYGDAIADFDAAIRLNPAYTNAYQNRAAARKAMGDSAGAKADLGLIAALQ